MPYEKYETIHSIMRDFNDNKLLCFSDYEIPEETMANLLDRYQYDTNFPIEDVECFRTLYQEHMVTKQDVFYTLETPDKHKDSLQYCSGFQTYINSSKTRNMVSNLADLCKVPRLLDNRPSVYKQEHPHFVTHMGEQSLFSLLTKKLKDDT